jgi:CSLREA domain-containing protein
VAALAAALLALGAPAVASAQFPGVFTVTTTKDGNDGECNQDCTLREALSLANAQSGNNVSLPPGVYKLTLGELVVRNNTIVLGTGTFNGQGAAARTTIIDAQGASRVINVPANQFAIVAGVTLTGGSAATGGGALVGNNGVLELFNASVDRNVATGRGGGVAVASGSLALLNTTISRNHAGLNGGGVAIDTQGDMTANVSTITGNSATGAGGGISSVGHFGLLNVTVANNTAASGGGIFIESGGAGGDDLANTIISGVGSGGACGGALVLEGRFGWSANLADDGTCGFTGAEGRSNLDPQLRGLNNYGGPTDTMALQTGSPAINAGDTQRCFQGDQRGAAFVGACDIGAFEFGGKPPEPVVPPPEAGKTVNVFTKRGTVRVKIPGSDHFFNLNDLQQIPVGSTIDTTHGRVTFQAAGKSKAWFYQGRFKFGQTKGKKPLSTLSLTAKLSCKGAGKATTARKKKRRRRLWGDGKGKFRTKGSFSSATVRGTKWLVQDTCQGTLTKVVRGKVAVKDFVRHRTVIVKAGHQYFAARKK